MKKFRLLSAFLTVVMVLGMLTGLPVFAADETDSEETEEKEALVPGYDQEKQEPTINYLKQVFETREDKLATMKRYLQKGDYELYVEPISGEIAYKNRKTGEILFSNPFDVGSLTSANSIKQELMSQIIIRYVDNGIENTMYSYVDACLRGQILVKKIKNGVRVEYTIGRAETRKLVPRHINRERFEELILSNIPVEDTEAISFFNSFFVLQDPFDPSLTERGKREMLAAFPICEKMAIYVFDPRAVEREFDIAEGYIKQYCPEYTYETLEEDHNITGYVGDDKAPPLFRLSLEYTLDSNGALNARLPANGIRFDESTYQLTDITVLPWFGAGTSEFNGYTFIPDGSGALIRFEDVKGKQVIITDKMYGQDYAYQEVGGQNREIMRMPVFGLVESMGWYIDELTEAEMLAGITAPDPPVYKMAHGFLAIIEEGDSLVTITTKHGGNTHKYNTVYTTFAPRPKDSYNLAEAISVGSNSSYTVVSERKYTDSLRLKFVMLIGDEEAEKVGYKDYYEATYVGMAKAYRDYLLDKGTISELETVEKTLPLYIESFGAIDTTEKFFSVPIEVLKPLTTFDDLKVMYEKLEADGITNVNYKLTGFANGGMNDTSPYHVKFESAVGGNKGFTDFAAYASEKGIGVYPDFDFANVGNFGLFDGISKGDHLVKTMDGRYTSKRYYDSTLQSFERGFALAVSPSAYSYFFKNFDKEYSKLSPIGVSASTLGTDLNSDFDKKDPYNREDSKVFTTDILSSMQDAYSNVMIEGGNIYTLPYVDHIINAPLDSSRHSNASEAVPFVGMVLHGCVNFTGTAINMAGDTRYEILKAIENGSNPYFTLSMQNTSLLKEDIEFNKYYSVAFDIWYEEVVDIYEELNGAIGNLQNKQIIDHEFILGERVPTAEELEADAKLEAEEAEKLAEEERIEAEKKELADKLAERLEALGDEAEVITGKDDDRFVYVPEEEIDPDAYVYTKYTCDDGRIVKVTYEGGKKFILNYNNFEITVVENGKTYTIGALDFAVVK